MIDLHRIEDVVVAITSLTREELLGLCEDISPCLKA
jgi:hypothetical protein